MKIWTREKRTLSLALVGFCVMGLALPAAGQQFGAGSPQSALVFQPGIMTTLAGTGVSGHTGDGGSAGAATVTTGIRGIVADGSGDVFFIDDTNETVRVVYEGGAVAASLITAENPGVTSPVVGDIYVVVGVEGSSGTPTTNKLATSVKITAGAALGIDAAGDLYVGASTDLIWVVYAGGTNTAGTNLIALEAGITAPTLGYIYPVAGHLTTNVYSGDGSLATASTVGIRGPNDVKFDTAGNMYIVDQGNNAIREVSAATGIITTIAGGGGTESPTAGQSPNGTVAAASLLNAPYGVAIDQSNNVYISDKNNNLIRVVYEGGSTVAALITLENPTIATPVAGDLYTIAGGGATTYPYAVLGTSGKLNGTTMIALDPAGNVYLAENGYNLVAEVNVITGYITVVAGTGTAGTPTGTDGDGGAATSATLNSLRCLTVDAAGRIYITDASDLRIRQVGPQGLIVFPGQAAGTTSNPLTILLSNDGNATLNFTGGSPTFGGPNYAYFALDPSSSLNTCNLTPLQPGASCVLAVTYSPQGVGASSATLSYATDGALSTQEIVLEGASLPNTATALLASTPSVVDGSIVTFTATVTGGASPAGLVYFYNNGTSLLGTATLNGSGVASFPYTTTATGPLSVTATYIGNATNAASSSTAVAVNVTGSGTSSTMVVAAPASLNQGQSVSLTATVTGGVGTPTGTVVFSTGGVSLGSGMLNGSGVATLSTTALPVGPNSIQALYLGDANYAASNSSAPVQVFGIPVVTLTASTTVINQGLSETITGTVTGNGVTPTGSLTIYDGSNVLGTATLVSGVATLVTSTLPGGPNSLTATYNGDGNYTSGTASAITVTVNVENVAFVHPGGWLTAADITRIRTAVANQTAPYYAAYLALPATPGTTFVPTGIAAEVTAGTVNSSSLTALQGNEEDIWILAVKWVATGTAGYATALCGAIDDYSAVLTTMDGNNGSLRAGIYGGKLAEAAEICAYANPAWPNKARAQTMFRQAFAQDIHDFSDSNIPNGNWETSCVHGMISIAIFLDDRDLFNRAVNYYLFGQGNGRVSNYVIDAAGQSQESGRDQGHTMDGINHLAEAAEDAWHQGIDLYGAYNSRLLAGFEYTGEYTSGAGTPAFVPNRDAWNDPLNSYFTLSATASPSSQPNWEMVYNHYVNRQGIGAPYTTDVVTASGYRPEPASQDFAGMGTLEFTRSAGQVDTVTSVPVAPIMLPSYGTSAGISINWVGSVGAASYNVKRASVSGGPYTTIASVTGESTYTYLDTSATTTGTPYFYLVKAVNSFGESTAGAETRASSGLPSPWANSDIGTPGLAGAGGTDYLGASTFSLRASGAVIGNSASLVYYNGSNTVYSPSAHSVAPLTDSFQFAYVSMTGDGQIVARVNAPLSPIASSAGLMMRDSLNSNAAMIANMAQYTGLALVTSRTTDGATASAAGPVAISTAAVAAPDESSIFVGPSWLKLTRSGNTFTSSVSVDNVTWTQINQQTIAMPSTIYAGLALASGNSTLPASAVFDEVNLPGWTPTSTAPAAPANLTASAGKGIQLTWSTSVGATSYTLTRSGPGGTTTLAAIPAPVAGLYAALPGTIYYVDYTGTPGSTYTYSVSATGAGGTGAVSASVSAVAPSASAPFITDSVNVPYATGTVGLPFTYAVQVSGAATFSASGLPAGLSISQSTGLISGTPTQSGVYQATVTASNSAGLDAWTYSMTIANPPPAGMQQTDIGFLEAPGITGISGSTIVNTGTGNGIGAVCDNFHYAYYQLTGDGSIVVNLNSVTTLSPTTTLSQTGIMMRNTLTCDSLMFSANTGIGGSTSVGAVYRTASNAVGTDYIDAATTSGANVTLPAYMQLVRSGNSFSAYSSPDGVTWTLVTTKSIAMNNTIYIGLDVNPSDDSPANTSTGTYRSVAIASAASSPINSSSAASGSVGVPFSFTITSAIFPATYSATGLPPGLTLDPSSGIISGTPTTAGSYSVTAGMANGVASGTAPLTITIAQGLQTISFTPATPVTYGVAPVSLSATGGASGNPVTFSVVSGPATLSNNTLTITGAGSVAIAANQAGSFNYAAATPVQATIVVNPAVLNVGVSGSPSRIFGQVNPAFSYTMGPFVGTDTQASATNGTPTLTTIAVPKSPVGSYAIVVTQGTLTAANYTFNLVDGTLSVSGNAPQVILFPALANFPHGTSVPLVAIATSGLPITYLVSGPASIDNSTGVLTISGTGNVTVTATQTGNSNFAGATSVSRTFTAQ